MIKELKILSECLKFAEEKFDLNFLENTDYETIGKKGKLPDIISAKTPRIVNLYKNSKKDLIKNSQLSDKDKILLSHDTIEFVQLITTLKHDTIEQNFLNEIIKELKSIEHKDYYGIKNELSVYQNYKLSGYPIIKIPKKSSKTPDFKIEIEKEPIYIECKSIISESIKLTPRLVSFREKLLKKIKDSIVINIVLDSKKAIDFEPEIEKLVSLAIKNNKEFVYSGKYSQVQLIKPKLTDDNNIDFVIPNFNPRNNIGSLIIKLINGRMIGCGVNFFPFFPNDFKGPLSKHLSRANNQIGKLGKGILHIQFPNIEVQDFIKLIAEHGHRIQDYLNKHSLLAVIIEIPYLIDNNEKENQVIPYISIPYFSSNKSLKRFFSLKPYWLKNYQILEPISLGHTYVFEFAPDKLLKFSILQITESNYEKNIRIYIIKDQLMYESIIENECSVNVTSINEELIQENNMLAVIIGELEFIYINGKKIVFV